MSRLTPLEITLRHRACEQPGCAICCEKPIGTVAQYLNQIGFHVRNFSDDHKTAFAFVEVVEDEDTCSQLLNQPIRSPASQLLH